MSCVALPKVVVNAEPFQFTVEPFTNPVPFTVSVKAPLPAMAELGLMVVMESFVVIKNVADPEMAWGVFCTRTLAVPGEATRAAPTDAVT